MAGANIPYTAGRVCNAGVEQEEPPLSSTTFGLFAKHTVGLEAHSRTDFPNRHPPAASVLAVLFCRHGYIWAE